ncbi:TetR family transcriptional regulator [Kineosporia mesophila]|uniref:TetR family transcriptional regulator n=1 Tax=Kineosporia mesophila TaxID=566012 RepID=A0ABP7AK07_9ACTN|nr:TetR family transcriptional regulator [Kineosporia mesophila]MCD5352443.1 TetR family transcriptional regulator [Kineosporia mesophila]
MPSEVLDPQAILDATEDVLRRHGPDKATVLDVARVLGVSHGSIYRHFRSKTALREAVIRRWLQASQPEVEAVLHGHSVNGSERLRSWLTTLFRAKWRQVSEDPELFATLQVLSASDSRIGLEFVGQMLHQIEELVAAGVADGSLRPVEPGPTAQAILDASTRFVHPALAAGWSAPGIDEDLQRLLDLLLTALAPVKTSKENDD